MDKPKKLKAVNWDATRFSMENPPSKMATKPMSQVPGKDLPSKLNAAVQKAKELGISNEKIKTKGKGQVYYQPTKTPNMNDIRFREGEMKISNPKKNEVKSYNTPFGSGSEPKKVDMKSSSSYKSNK
jgi:hypothetical protein